MRYDFLSYLFPKKIVEVKDGDNTYSIIEKGNFRIFEYNGITYSKVNNNSVYTGEYWDYFLPCAYVVKSPKILLIGLGGGTIAYELNSLFGNNISLDIVETNGKIAELADALVPGGIKGNVFIRKGEDFVKLKKNQYDLIFLDAYTDNKIPAPFLDFDFINDAYTALSNEGILAINFAMGMMGVEAFFEYTTKLKQKFKVYDVKAAMNEGNVIIICSKTLVKEELLKRMREGMSINKENKTMLEHYERMTEV